MKYKDLLLTLAALCTVVAAAAKPVSVKSPDSRTVLSFEGFKYSVTVDGRQVLQPSAMSMTLQDGTVFGGAARLQKTSRRSVDQVLHPAVYKRSTVRDNYNEATLSYKDFDLVFRVYNEGVAYRFVGKVAGGYKVSAEQVEYVFSPADQAFVTYSNSRGETYEEQTVNSYEDVYVHAPLGEWDASKIATLPLVVESQGYKVAITEADLWSYPGLYLTNKDKDGTLQGYFPAYPDLVVQGGHNNLQGMVKTRKDYLAECRGRTEFPWRVMQIAREDTELAQSDMVYKLARPAAEADWSWVRPGKVAWDWWNAWNLYGVDFEAGINNQTYKYYIDFAASKGIEYVILDEGWAVNLQADLMQVVPEIDIEELVSYAGSKGVGLILWAGYWAVARDMENVFLHYSRMGIKGFKIDFMNRDDAQMVDFYEAAAAMGAKYKMLIDFHGAYKPTGLHRTYPNVINFEAVHGLEQMKWQKWDRQVVFDVTVPYIRMLAGPMDYTQGAMRNATRKNYRPVNSEPMSLGTRCRQLAEYMVFDAPLTMLCDSPSNYLRESECTDFIASVPTVWDETKVLNGVISQYITVARRSGDDWYVGSMTDWDERDLMLSLGFLPAGTFRMEIFKDGPNAHRAARDFARQTLTVTASDKVAIHMAPGGGWAARITKL